MIENRTIITSEYSANKRKLLKSILLIRVLLTFAYGNENFFLHDKKQISMIQLESLVDEMKNFYKRGRTVPY